MGLSFRRALLPVFLPRLDERFFGEFRFAAWTTSRLAEDEVERSVFPEHIRDDEGERYVGFIVAASFAPGDIRFCCTDGCGLD